MEAGYHSERAEDAEAKVLHLKQMEEQKRKQHKVHEFRKLQQKVAQISKKRQRLVINNIPTALKDPKS